MELRFKNEDTKIKLKEIQEKFTLELLQKDFLEKSKHIDYKRSGLVRDRT